MPQRNEAFGTRLRQAMIQQYGAIHGNQTAVVKDINALGDRCRRTDFGLYLRGKVPEWTRLVVIGRVLGVSVDWLLTGEAGDRQEVRNLPPDIQRLITQLETMTPPERQRVEQVVTLIRAGSVPWLLDQIEVLAEFEAIQRRLRTDPDRQLGAPHVPES